MMNSKLSLTIAISAFNEGKNIQKLVIALLKQDVINFVLDQIIILSDGSTDDTSQLIRNINDRRIRLIEEKKRCGKPHRVNQLFTLVNSDVIVILDGDITLSSSQVINDLILPMVEDSSVMLTSGKALPFKPKLTSENIFYAGTEIWNSAKYSVKNNSLYLCEGEIRAFRKALYKEMKFPPASAEDVYPFLYCMEKGYIFKPVEKSLVYYHLPKTFKDYLKQFNRFWKSEKIQEANFSKELTDKYYTINWRAKIYSAFKNITKNTFWTIVYLVFLIMPKVIFYFMQSGETKSVWEVSSTTKS